MQTHSLRSLVFYRNNQSANFLSFCIACLTSVLACKHQLKLPHYSKCSFISAFKCKRSWIHTTYPWAVFLPLKRQSTVFSPNTFYMCTVDISSHVLNLTFVINHSMLLCVLIELWLGRSLVLAWKHLTSVIRRNEHAINGHLMFCGPGAQTGSKHWLPVIQRRPTSMRMPASRWMMPLLNGTARQATSSAQIRH